MSEVVAGTGIIVPTSPNDRLKLKNQLTEAVNSLASQASHREHFKAVIETIHKDFEIPKKVAAKLARTWHKNNYAEMTAEMEDFEVLYETIVEGAKPSDTQQ